MNPYEFGKMMHDSSLFWSELFGRVVAIVIAIGGALVGMRYVVEVPKPIKKGMFFTGLAFLGLGCVGAILMLISAISKGRQGPEFEVSFLYSLGNGHETEYEVTNMLFWDSGLSEEYWEERVGLLVRAIYVPSNPGPVEVTVLGKDGAKLAGPQSWDLATDPTMMIDFAISELIKRSGLKVNPSGYDIEAFERPKGLRYEEAHVFVEINRFGTNDILYRKQLRILNTPWYHYTILSTTYPEPGGQITAHVRGYNVGGPSDFNLVCNLWRVDSTIEFEHNWGIGNVWERVARDETVIIEDVPEGGFIDKKCTLPSPEDTFSFDDPGIFAFETYLVKKQDYAIPKGGEGFFECEQKWEFQDPSDVFVVIMKKSG